jgi:hypothetical protein
MSASRKEEMLKLCHLIEALPASEKQTEISILASDIYKRCPAPKPAQTRACSNFKVSEDDPSFCINCGDFASMHKGPTPGAIRTFRW